MVIAAFNLTRGVGGWSRAGGLNEQKRMHSMGRDGYSSLFLKPHTDTVLLNT